jgi:hypothetical protein
VQRKRSQSVHFRNSMAAVTAGGMVLLSGKPSAWPHC